MTTRSPTLSPELLRQGVEELCARDADLSGVVQRYGPPPMWSRPPGFATLVRIILEQQVSLSSGRAAFERLQAGAGRVSAERLAAFSPRQIGAFGITRQKAGFIQGLAESIAERRMSLAALASSDDLAARQALLDVKGIGPWTADIYLMMALRRADVWPHGDLALVKSLAVLKRLRSDPRPEVVQRLTAPWTPWRAVAARIVWHNYLSERRNGRS